MPVNCEFCGEIGHRIRDCSSNEGILLYECMNSIALQYINGYNFLPWNEKTLLFYTYLKTLKNKELKMILNELYKKRIIFSRWLYDNRSVKIEMISTIIQNYFYRYLVYQYNGGITLEDGLISLYIRYWNYVVCYRIHDISVSSMDRFVHEIVRIRRQHTISNTTTTISNPYKYIKIQLIPRDSTEENFECPICLDEQCPSEKVIVNCKHSFCKSCVNQVVHFARVKNQPACCALCRTSYSEIQVSTYENLQTFEK